MSFSSKVKEEILLVFGEDRHCRIAALSAIIYNSCKIEIEYDSFLDKMYILNLKTDNFNIKKIFNQLIQTDFKAFFELKNGTDKQKLNEVTIKILQATGFLNGKSSEVERKINHLAVKSVCCKKAYLRAAFLCTGSINDPDKTYHLEFVTDNAGYCVQITELLEFFGLAPKNVIRKDRHIVYFKESEQISNILNIIGAHISLMEYENSRAFKDMGNNINRLANCETANADKLVSASVKQIEDIMFIKKTAGLDSLSLQLAEIASLRLKNPELSLTQIGQRLSPVLGKSGVNHRLRKIAQIADELRDSFDVT